MSKNYLGQAFLIVIGAIALWYTALAGYHYYSYTRLEMQTTPVTLDWEVLEVSDEVFVPQATYTFKVGTSVFSGQTTWGSEVYRNQWGAQASLPEFSAKWRKVWYDPKNPQHSSLQKKFPFKESISAAVLWGVWLYFLWLGYYISRFKKR